MIAFWVSCLPLLSRWVAFSQHAHGGLDHVQVFVIMDDAVIMITVLRAPFFSYSQLFSPRFPRSAITASVGMNIFLTHNMSFQIASQWGCTKTRTKTKRSRQHGGLGLYLASANFTGKEWHRVIFVSVLQAGWATLVMCCLFPVFCSWIPPFTYWHFYIFPFICANSNGPFSCSPTPAKDTWLLFPFWVSGDWFLGFCFFFMSLNFVFCFSLYI